MCVTIGYTEDRPGIQVDVTFLGNQFFHKEISAANIKPICFKKFQTVSDICVELYDVNVKSKHACVKLSCKILFKKLNFNLGCI